MTTAPRLLTLRANALDRELRLHAVPHPRARAGAELMRHEHDPEPRITLRTLAGGALFAGSIWLWLSAAAILEEVLFP